MTQVSLLNVVVPFVKRAKSKKIMMDCPIVYHNPIIYENLKCNGTEAFSSGGCPFDAEGRYPEFS